MTEGEETADLLQPKGGENESYFTIERACS